MKLIEILSNYIIKFLILLIRLGAVISLMSFRKSLNFNKILHIYIFFWFWYKKSMKLYFVVILLEPPKTAAKVEKPFLCLAAQNFQAIWQKQQSRKEPNPSKKKKKKNNRKKGQT